MTVGDLRRLLSEFADDQWVFVDLFSDRNPDGSQVQIQAVRAVPPWYPEQELVGLVCHAMNADVPKGSVVALPGSRHVWPAAARSMEAYRKGGG